MLDYVITGGHVIDGTGNPWFRADVGLSDGRIVAIGDLRQGSSRVKLDISGMAVSPGFIDLHGHSDFTLLVNPRGESKVRQGVTTEVNGNCGGWAAPLYGPARNWAISRIQRYGLPVEPDWMTIGDYLSKLERQGVGHNVAMLVGHGNLRAGVIGLANRPPTHGELAVLEERLDQALSEGAVGMSTGLPFVPGNYASTDELVSLGKVLARRGAIYATHIRDEGNSSVGLLPALQEAIEIAERSGVPTEISHLKAIGRPSWSRSDEILKLIDAARSRGVDVTGDQYPYVASQANLGGSVLPKWALEGKWEDTMQRVRDRALRTRLISEINANMEREQVRPEDFVIAMFTPDPDLSGLSLKVIAERSGVSPAEATLDLLSKGEASVIRFVMSEDDVTNIMQHPVVAIASDGFGLANYGPLSQGRHHPRCFGTFPRVLGKYSRVHRMLRLEEAIRKMTSLPAQRLRLRDRGLLRQGFWGDLVVFDPASVEDRATFSDPYAYPVGIHTVFVNGVPVVANGSHTGALPGRVLRFGTA